VNERSRFVSGTVGSEVLLAAPIIKHGDLMNTGNRATWRAGFLSVVLAMPALGGILGERDARVAALLRAVVHQAVLANVEVTRARAAAPSVFASGGDIMLKGIDPREGAFSEGHDFLEDFAFVRVERPELTVAVVNDADSRGKTKLDGAARDNQCIVGMLDAAAQDGIDIDVKIGVLGQKLQFLVENLEALLGHIVGLDVVDADLQVFQTRVIESLDAVGVEKIAVGDDPGDDAVVADAANDFVEIGMEQRFASADGDYRGAEPAQAVDAALHFFERHGFREIVELVAICAGKIAPAHGDDMREERMLGREQRLGNHAPASHRAMRGEQAAPDFRACRHSYCERASS
jgi:hypothetical protein